MNILYLNNSVHLGGDTKCILKLCNEFKDNNNLFIASCGGELQNEFEKIGVKHFTIKNVVNKNPYVILSNIYKLIKIVKKYKIDIIHSHHRMATLTAKIVRSFTGIKVIHTQHLCINDKLKLTKFALKSVKVITVSQAAKDILVQKSGLNNKDIVTIYNTIETENENKKVDEKLLELREQGYFIVAQVSRARDYKGIYDFLEIANETFKENKNIKFVFIGDGPELNEMKKIIDDRNMEEFVYLLGSKNNVIEHLKYIDLFILCSYIEGLPLSPIEAFSQGIPVIATDIEGTNEEVINGKNGFLVDVKNVIDFKKKILYLYENKEVLERLKNGSYKIYEEKFNANIYREKHLNIYKEITKRR